MHSLNKYFSMSTMNLITTLAIDNETEKKPLTIWYIHSSGRSDAYLSKGHRIQTQSLWLQNLYSTFTLPRSKLPKLGHCYLHSSLSAKYHFFSILGCTAFTSLKSWNLGVFYIIHEERNLWAVGRVVNHNIADTLVQVWIWLNTKIFVSINIKCSWIWA
jgi:hypothetical protein